MEFSFHGSTAYDSYRKILLTMRLTAILLLAGFLHAGANGFSQTVTLSVSKMPLEKVCSEIERQTGYYFVYAKNMNEKSLLVTVELKNMGINDALHKVFAGLPFTYQVIDKVVVINTVSPPPPATVNTAASGAIEITGRIISNQAEPLVNASVVVVRTKDATETNAKGEFRLKGVTGSDELIVSYIGYKTQKVKIANRTNFIVILEVTDNELDKVVVQAYGTTSRRLTTSDIGVLTAEEIKKQPLMNPLLALEGRVAGLQVTPQTGYESGPVKVEIRGRNGVNPNFTSDPLYIIDGVPLTVLDVKGTLNSAYSSNALSRGFDQSGMPSPTGGQNPLFSLNGADIESIEVLKDADATAIYGSRGANGVILITTKKGRPGKNHFDLDIAQGVSLVTRYWDMLNTSQYLAMRREAFKNDGITPSAAAGAGFAPDLFIWDTTRYTNWQKYLWGGTGKWTNVQAGLSGGTSQTSFRIGAGYNRSTDISTASGANQKASLSFSLNNHSVNQRFRVSLAANYSFTDANIINISGSAANLAPDAPPVLDSRGNLNYAQWKASGVTYPFAGSLWPYESKNSFLTSNIGFNYTIIKGLVARATIGYNNTITNNTLFTTIASQDPTTTPKPLGSASFGNTQIQNWIMEPQLEYNGLLGGGGLNILVGGTVQSNTTKGLLVTGNGYTDDALLHTITNAPIIKAFDYSGAYKYAGAFARIGYKWANKYILNLNARRDGSSRFGAGKQFGNFGSVGAAWILSDENWLKRILPSAISFVKLRGSYGITGSDAVGDYQYLSQWGNSTPVLGAYDGISPLTPQIEDNPNFHWQVNKKLEGALDLSFLNDRINLEVAYYRNRCNNQLVGFPIAAFTGFTSVTANSPASVQNSGLEFTLNAKVIDSKKFTWAVDFNIGINRNKLLAYPNLSQSPYYTQYKIGQSLDNKYLFNYTGIDPLTGQYTYTDWNHDGKITANESVAKGTGNDDRYYALNIAPKFEGGLGNQFRYKNWQLSAFFMYKDQLGNNALRASTPGNMANASVWQYNNRWQHPGDVSNAPRLTTQTLALSDLNLSGSNGNWTDASFIRLRTLALSYLLPAKWCHKAGMSGVSVNMNAQNLFVITRYQGLDPEINTFGALPPARTITAGITCSF